MATATAEIGSGTREAQPPPSPLDGLEGVMDVLGDLPPKEPFRRSDPVEAARAHDAGAGRAAGSGVAAEEEEISGLEQEYPLANVAFDRPVTAIDAGVAPLGKTPDGRVVAFRAAAWTVLPDGRAEARLFKTGVGVLTPDNQLEVLHRMGVAMGKPDFYVRLEGGRPVAEKRASHVDRQLDRMRNFLERMVQLQVCRDATDAIILLDGALTLRTHDTPGSFMQRLGALCSESDCSLVGISKHTRLTLAGRDITSYLNRTPGRPSRRRLTVALQNGGGNGNGRPGESRVMGDVFVVRFAAGASAYRVDITPTPGITAASGIDELAAACRHRCGYPEPLVRAHFESYFTPPAIAELQANAIAQYDLEVVPEPRLTPVFAPFGGRFK